MTAESSMSADVLGRLSRAVSLLSTDVRAYLCAFGGCCKILGTSWPQLSFTPVHKMSLKTF